MNEEEEEEEEQFLFLTEEEELEMDFTFAEELINQKTELFENNIRKFKGEIQRTDRQLELYKKETETNKEKIKLHKLKRLRYLVAFVAEILESRVTKCKFAVLRTSTCMSVLVPVAEGLLVGPRRLRPGDMVGVDRASYAIIEILPPEAYPLVKVKRVDKMPTENYYDIGGLEKQIRELVEATVLPIIQKQRFQKLGIRSPKGVLLHGPTGTGKTLVARALAANTTVRFLNLAGPELVTMSKGSGAQFVSDSFLIAKVASPCIIFIDEIDAIGRKRSEVGGHSEVGGDSEADSTLMELLKQLDGLNTDDSIKVIAATNRYDLLDPDLKRSGRFDRKIEFPYPNKEGRAQILKIHSRKMSVHSDVNFEELARSTNDFSGAQLKAVCVEAGMAALRRDATKVNHDDFNQGIIEVGGKKASLRPSLSYYA